MFLGSVVRSLGRLNVSSGSGSSLVQSLLSPVSSCLLVPSVGDNLIQSRNYAARKGTRIKRALEARRRALIRKTMPKPDKKKRYAYQSSALKAQVTRSDFTGLPLPLDDVYYAQGFVVPTYSMKDALAMHRETHSLTMYGAESALVHTRIELYMKAKRKTKFQDPFSSTVTYPHPFELKRRSRIIAITKSIEEQEAAKAAGAILAGGDDIIRNIKSGLVSSIDYEHLVCHTDMLIPLTAIRGILGNNFPSKAKGNFGNDIVGLVKKFTEGYDYQCSKNVTQDNFGYVDFPIGTLNMSDDQLAANLLALLQDIERCRASEAPGQFPETIWLISEETNERFKIKFWELTDKYVDIFSSSEFEDQVSALLKTLKVETTQSTK